MIALFLINICYLYEYYIDIQNIWTSIKSYSNHVAIIKLVKQIYEHCNIVQF